MRKIVILCQMDIVGTDSWEFVEVEDTTTDEELDALAYELAVENAAMYGFYPASDETSEEETDDNIGGIWYDYVPELHDMHTNSGQPHWD